MKEHRSTAEHTGNVPSSPSLPRSVKNSLTSLTCFCAQTVPSFSGSYRLREEELRSVGRAAGAILEIACEAVHSEKSGTCQQLSELAEMLRRVSAPLNAADSSEWLSSCRRDAKDHRMFSATSQTSIQESETARRSGKATATKVIQRPESEGFQKAESRMLRPVPRSVPTELRCGASGTDSFQGACTAHMELSEDRLYSSAVVHQNPKP